MVDTELRIFWIIIHPLLHFQFVSNPNTKRVASFLYVCLPFSLKFSFQVEQTKFLVRSPGAPDEVSLCKIRSALDVSPVCDHKCAVATKMPFTTSSSVICY